MTMTGIENVLTQGSERKRLQTGQSRQARTKTTTSNLYPLLIQKHNGSSNIEFIKYVSAWIYDC